MYKGYIRHIELVNPRQIYLLIFFHLSFHPHLSSHAAPLLVSSTASYLSQPFPFSFLVHFSLIQVCVCAG